MRQLTKILVLLSFFLTMIGSPHALESQTLDSKRFESSIKKNGKVVFEGVDQFTKFDIGIPLRYSGASLVGFKDLKVLDDNKANVRIHIKYGNIDFSVGICFEYYPQNTFMAARTSFNNKDWGGLKKIMPSSRCIGTWELDDNKSKLEELGVYAVMDDIQLQQNTRQLLEVLDEQTNGSLCFLLAKIITEKNCAHVPTIQEQAQEQPVEDELDTELAEALFDGRYSFNILREANFGVSKSIGNGYIEINNGIMTVAKEGRTIEVDSEDLYDLFEGRIDKKGNISARFTMYPMCGTFELQTLEYSGNINGQLKTDCGGGGGQDIYTLLELKKEQ